MTNDAKSQASELLDESKNDEKLENDEIPVEFIKLDEKSCFLLRGDKNSVERMESPWFYKLFVGMLELDLFTAFYFLLGFHHFANEVANVFIGFYLFVQSAFFLVASCLFLVKTHLRKGKPNDFIFYDTKSPSFDVVRFNYRENSLLDSFYYQPAAIPVFSIHHLIASFKCELEGDDILSEKHRSDFRLYYRYKSDNLIVRVQSIKLFFERIKLVVLQPESKVISRCNTLRSFFYLNPKRVYARVDEKNKIRFMLKRSNDALDLLWKILEKPATLIGDNANFDLYSSFQGCDNKYETQELLILSLKEKKRLIQFFGSQDETDRFLEYARILENESGLRLKEFALCCDFDSFTSLDMRNLVEIEKIN